MRRIISVLIICCVLTTLTYAGIIRVFQCSNDNCEFKAEVFSGIGKASTRIPGYCTRCDKIVTVSYSNKDLKKGKPIPVDQVWDSETGRMLDLYECPHCKKPFAVIDEMIFCPKCGKKSITESVEGNWD